MDNYNLKKIKLQSDGGIEALYHEKVRKDENVYWLEKSVKSMIHRHSDMDDVAAKLEIHVARMFGLLAVGLYKDESDFNKQEQLLLKDTLETMQIVGIAYSGEEDTLGCVITAKRTVLGGKTIVMNTPFIPFTYEKYDYCYDLGEIYKEMSAEVYQYIFKRKFAQLELAFEGEAEETGGVTASAGAEAENVGDVPNLDAQKTDAAIGKEVAEFKEKKAAETKAKKEAKAKAKPKAKPKAKTEAVKA